MSMHTRIKRWKLYRLLSYVLQQQQPTPSSPPVITNVKSLKKVWSILKTEKTKKVVSYLFVGFLLKYSYWVYENIWERESSSS